MVPLYIMIDMLLPCRLLYVIMVYFQLEENIERAGLKLIVELWFAEEMWVINQSLLQWNVMPSIFSSAVMLLVSYKDCVALSYK